jgi:hypothetical protein
MVGWSSVRKIRLRFDAVDSQSRIGIIRDGHSVVRTPSLASTRERPIALRIEAQAFLTASGCSL